MELEPDIVLLDIRMPDMDGMATLKELRRNGYIGPALSLSGDRYFLNGHEMAFDANLTKPMSIEEIVEAISFHLKRP